MRRCRSCSRRSSRLCRERLGGAGVAVEGPVDYVRRDEAVQEWQ